MSPKTWPLPAAPLSATPARRLAAACLRTASSMLEALAQGLEARPQARSLDQAFVEYHAEAGAPEGALFVNGEFVGWIDGVKRL